MLLAVVSPKETKSGAKCNDYIYIPKPSKDTYQDATARMVLVCIENAKQKGLKTPLPSIATAQLIVESNSGRSYLSQKANNFHGIRAKRGEPYILAFDDGAMRKFKRFSSKQASINEYLKLLNNYRYKNVFKELTPYGQALAIQNAGYASNPRYANIITATVKKYKLNNYDQ